MKTMVMTAFALVLSASFASAQDAAPAELGDVKWQRDLDEALEQAKALDRDVFVLFQEVPG